MSHLVVLLVMLMSGVVLADEVGRVKLLIGSAHIERAGVVMPLHQGDSVLENDTIQSAASSLLQIKTNDNAYVSLRADSILHIACYNAACMKLNLLQGEMRQITGDMGQANKQNYRLNTPVAAIGVRGTDFITRADAANTYVRVVEGAIVAAPFEKDCSPNGLGACSTAHSALLSAKDPFILHLQPNVAPVAQPGNGGLQAKAPVASFANGAVASANRINGDDVLYVLRDHPEVIQAYRQSLSGVNLPSLPVAKVTPALQYSTWLDTSNGIATDYAQASNGRQITVGDASYALWRDESVPYMPTQGKIDYQLSGSQAIIANVKENSALPAQVVQGQLAINFDTKQLSTQLSVQPNGTSVPIQVSSVGLLTRNDGIFALTTQQGGTVAGAISSDNKTVAYMVNQPLNWQILKAITTWQAK